MQSIFQQYIRHKIFIFAPILFFFSLSSIGQRNTFFVSTELQMILALHFISRRHSRVCASTITRWDRDKGFEKKTSKFKLHYPITRNTSKRDYLSLSNRIPSTVFGFFYDRFSETPLFFLFFFFNLALLRSPEYYITIFQASGCNIFMSNAVSELFSSS